MRIRRSFVIATAIAIVVSATATLISQVGVAEAAACSGTGSIVRINAGGEALVDDDGNAWRADCGYIGGKTASVGAPITGTTKDGLYQDERWGMTGYKIPVSNGTKTVHLRFAEIVPKSGVRIMNVSIEGKTVIDELNVAAKVGNYAAYHTSFTTKVSDGVLNLGFAADRNTATISAIEIIGTGITAPPVKPALPTSPPPPLTSKPDASNTGVPPGTKLTRHDGDITITKDGTLIEGLDIYGYVKVRAANVTIKNSIVRGSTSIPTGNTALIDCNAPAVKRARISHVTLVPQRPNLWINGVIGHDYWADRVHVYNTVDGFGVYNNTGDKVNANVSITNSYIHDQSYFANDPNHSNGPTHNDGIQVQGGANVTIVGNNIQAFLSKSAGDQNYPYRQSSNGILVQENVSAVTNVKIKDNWIDGAKVSLYLYARKPMNVGEVSGNRFGTNQLDFGNGSKYQIRVTNRDWVTTGKPLTTNVWDATGASLAEGRNSGIRYDS